MTQIGSNLCHRSATDSSVGTLFQKAVYTVKMLLKVGETVSRNTYSKLKRTNKTNFAVSCWLPKIIIHLNRPGGGGRRFSRLVPAELFASAVVMLDTPCSEVVWRVLATHSIRQFPLHFPHPCVTVCQHISTGVYLSMCSNYWIHSFCCPNPFAVHNLVFRLLLDEENVEYEASGTVCSFVLSCSLCLLWTM